MSRSSKRDNSSSVSLFPFLAVLLCTMGGLVVLLVAVSHVSRGLARQEKAKAEARAAQQAAPDTLAAEELQRAREQSRLLSERAAQATERVNEDQLRLAQVEQHVRKLQDEMALILVAAQEIERSASEKLDDRAQAERELRRLEQLIEDTKREIEQALTEQEGQHKSYAVVPYKGSSGTRRPPLYIECRAERVLLQPEGVELKPEDFASPLGVGNPLAAALRAARDHFARLNPDAGFDPDAAPYPLVLVRPDGIGAYYRVREAIRSWDADFGYELIDGDWDLEFPAPDPQLASVEARAIDNARLRREALAQAAPSAFGGAGGSFAIETDDASTPRYEPYDPSLLGGGDGNGGAPGRGPAGPSAGYGQHAATDRGENPAGASGGPGYPATGASTDRYNNPGSDGVVGQAGTQTAAVGASPSPTQGPGSTNQQQGSPLLDTRPDDAAGERPGAKGGADRYAAGAGGQGQASSAGGVGTSGSMGSAKDAVAAAATLNDRSRPEDVAIRRSVKLSVFADRVLVGSSTTPLSMPGPTAAHVDALVANVKRQIADWGLAGSGLYWRPTIKLEVREGGERRAEELRQILGHAGVDLEPPQTAALPASEANRETR